MGLGIAIQIPTGYFCQIQQKSGLAEKFGIDTIGNVIDSGYRGEIHAQIVNTSNDYITIQENTKIAQLVFIQHQTPEIQYCDELSITDRGSSGFGSSGLK